MKNSVPAPVEQPCRKQGDDDGRRKEVPDHLPEAVGGDQQVVDAVQHHADPQNPHRAGAGEPRTAENIFTAEGFPDRIFCLHKIKVWYICRQRYYF